MPKAPGQIPENVDFAAQERALEAPANERLAMLESIAKALTRRLLKDNPALELRNSLSEFRDS
jgi:hypothetical protein